jgi:glycosyltransferase involved in cell wall biosynthesis
MERDKRVFILGYFGFNTNQLDGQTIKTRNILALLQDHKIKCDYFDTELLKYNKFAIVTMLFKLIRTDTVFYLPAQNNLNYFFPIIFTVSILFKIRIFYFVVGGWLPTYIKNKKLHQRLLFRIEHIFCETHRMIESLKSQYGFQNVGWFPNFRIHQYSPGVTTRASKFRVVFLSRINIKKGIDFVFNYAQKVKDEQLPVAIDFYGPILQSDLAYFNESVSKFEFVQYRGAVQPEDIHTTLNCYDVMVLPTKYFTEGFPGAVLDAYIAGIPVIVSEWMHAHEFVVHEETGLIFKFGDQNDFFLQLERLRNDEELQERMKKSAHAKSREFSSDFAWQLINDHTALEKHVK